MSDGDTETDDKYDRSDVFTDSDNNAFWDDWDKYTGHFIDHNDKELNEKTQDDKYVPLYGNKTKCCNDSSSSDEDIQNGSSSLTDEEFSDEIETCEPFQHEKEGTSKPNKQRQPLKRALKRVICYERKSSKGKSNTKLTKLEEQYKVLKKEVDSITKFKQYMIQYCRNKQQQCDVNTNLDKNLKRHIFFDKSRINRNRKCFREVEEMTMTGRFNEVTELRQPEMTLKKSLFVQNIKSESEHELRLLRVLNYPNIGQSINMVCNMKTCRQIERYLYSIVSNNQHDENHPYNHQQAVLHHVSCDQKLIAVDTQIEAVISAEQAIVDTQVEAVISADQAIVDLNQLVRSDWYDINVCECSKDRMIFESAIFIDKRQSNGVIIIFRIRQYSSGKIEYDLTWNIIQTTQNASSTHAVISTCRGIRGIQYGTNAPVEIGSVFHFLQLLEPTNEANDPPNSYHTGQIAVPTLLQLDILKSHKNAINLVAQPKQNQTRPVHLEECNSNSTHCTFIPSFIMHMRGQNEIVTTKGALSERYSYEQKTLKAYTMLKFSRKYNKERSTDHINFKISTANQNDSKQLTDILPFVIQPVKINKRCRSQASSQDFTNESSTYKTFQKFNHQTTDTHTTRKNHKRNKAGKLKTSKHQIADCSMSRVAGALLLISKDKPKILKTLRPWWYKTSKKQNYRSPNFKMKRPRNSPSKKQLNLARKYILHRKETHVFFTRNQTLDTKKSRFLMLKKGSPYVKRHKDQSSRLHKVNNNKGNACHVNSKINTNISNENQYFMSFGCANEDVYDTCIFEEDLCLYEDGNVDETVQDSIQVKGIFPTGIEESTEIHTIHDRLPHQSPSIRVHIVQPTMEQEERSEICTTLTSFDKSRAPNSHPFKVNFRIPLAGGTSSHIVLKNTCSVDGFLLMIYVLLEENLTIRTQFEHSEHDLHKIYHQIWKKFTEGNFGDGKIAWGKYGGYIEDLEANGARTDKIIDIIGRENERIFCVLAKHRFPLRVHCSLVGDVYFTTQLYNVLPLYEVQGEPLYDTIKRAINKFLRGDDLPCYRTHENIKEKCRGNSVQTLVEPPLILPINLFFLNYGKKKYSSNEIPEIVESNEHRYELYMVRFFIEGVKHFVDKIKIYGSWALYDDCREKLYHFDVDPEYVQLSSCYFVKV